MTQPKYAKGDLVTTKLSEFDASRLNRGCTIGINEHDIHSHTRPEPKTKDVWLTWVKPDHSPDQVIAFHKKEDAEDFCGHRRGAITRAFKVTIPRDE